MFAGEAGAVMMTEISSASNATIKRELGCQASDPSWCQASRRELGQAAA